MAKLTDGLELNPWRPSVVENVEHTAHTQIAIPLGRARAVAMVRFLGLFGDVLIVVAVLAALYYLVAGPQWAGFVLVGVACILAALAWAFGPPMAEFVDAQMKDLRDPFRDSEFRALQEMRMAQPAPAPPPVLRVEAHMGGGQYRYAALPGPSRQAFVWLARDVVRGLPFALRTATRQKYSRAQFDSLRDRFFEAGWAVWANEDAHAQGVLLTEEGMRVMQDAAASSLAEARRGC